MAFISRLPKNYAQFDKYARVDMQASNRSDYAAHAWETLFLRFQLVSKSNVTMYIGAPENMLALSKQSPHGKLFN